MHVLFSSFARWQQFGCLVWLLHSFIPALPPAATGEELLRVLTGQRPCTYINQLPWCNRIFTAPSRGQQLTRLFFFPTSASTKNFAPFFGNFIAQRRIKGCLRFPFSFLSALQPWKRTIVLCCVQGRNVLFVTRVYIHKAR